MQYFRVTVQVPFYYYEICYLATTLHNNGALIREISTSRF